MRGNGTNAVARVWGVTIRTECGRALLDGVDLELRPGVTALLGESGAGKTTLAFALQGWLGKGLQRCGGLVEVAGRDPFTRDGRRALRGRVTGYVPQDPGSALDPRRTILAQLLEAARISGRGSSRAEREERIRSAARSAAFDESLLRRRPAALSGGQAQRALLARTFVVRPRLVILDEPTSGLDDVTAERVGRAFAELPWRPAVLLITHDRALASSIADRTLELEGGRLRPVRPLPVVGNPSRPTRAPEESPKEAAVVVEELTIRRGAMTLLEPATLRFGAAELVALRGVSGSGKTSIAHALCGLAAPMGGRLLVHGTAVSWDAGSRAHEGGPFLAYVGQDARASLNPGERLETTLARAVRSARRRRGAPVWDAETLLRRLSLPPDAADRTPERLSGGQRHRAALARAIIANPQLLVLDETLAALDDRTAGVVLDALDDWRRESGTPVLLITHRDAVARRADRVLTLTERRIS